MPQILPLLNDTGLLLLQLPSVVGDPGPEPRPALTTRIEHVATGEFIEATTPLMLDRDNSQGLGSAITYTRRYALLSILGLVADQDDDGEKASKSSRKKPEVVNQPKGSSRSKKKTDDTEEDW